MRLTASFYINKHLFQELYDKSYISNNLCNQANWIINDIYKNEERYINYFELDKCVKINFRNTEYNNYDKLGGALSQQILRLLDKNWKSFLKV